VCKRPCASGAPAPEAKTTRKLRGCSVTRGRSERENLPDYRSGASSPESSGGRRNCRSRSNPGNSIPIGQRVMIAGHELGEDERCGVVFATSIRGPARKPWQCAHRADSDQSGIITSWLAARANPLFSTTSSDGPTEFTGDPCELQSGRCIGVRAVEAPAQISCSWV